MNISKLLSGNLAKNRRHVVLSLLHAMPVDKERCSLLLKIL